MSITISRLTGFTGAEVAGVDLSAPLDEANAAALREALAAHHVLIIRDQQLSTTEQLTVTELFGPAIELPYVTPMAGDPHVIEVLKEADEVDTGVFGGDWHSDFSFLDNPPAGSVLHAIELPPVGGDTVWSNQVEAYRTLPADLRAAVEGRNAVHTGKPYGVSHAPTADLANASMQMVRGDPAADRETMHPAAITVPEGGHRALFVNPIYTTRLDGMTEADSAPILAAIHRHAVRPDFGYRHRWRAGDVVVWNNRTTMHYATNDYDGHRRLLHRTTFERQPPRP